MTLDLTRDTTLVAGADLASCELGGETVVLNLDTGIYYGMDPVGTCVWRLLREPRSIREVCAVVVDEFDVSTERCESDVLAFAASLGEHGLLRTCSDVDQ
jgi:hypothetical protein